MSKQAKELCKSVAGELNPHAVELAEQLVFMEKKLKETRRELKNAPISIEYFDTNGQTRTKANPAFDAYNHLLNSFIKALSELRSILNVEKGETKTGTLARFEVLAGSKKRVKDA